MFKKIKKYIKYWYYLNIKKQHYLFVSRIKKVICTLPPVVIGDLRIAQGMEVIDFTEKELMEQGKFPVGKPLSFPIKGCTIAASNRAMTKEVILNDLEANAYSTLEIDKERRIITIQPYFVK